MLGFLIFLNRGFQFSSTFGVLHRLPFDCLALLRLLGHRLSKILDLLINGREFPNRNSRWGWAFGFLTGTGSAGCNDSLVCRRAQNFAVLAAWSSRWQ